MDEANKRLACDFLQREMGSRDLNPGSEALAAPRHRALGIPPLLTPALSYQAQQLSSISCFPLKISQNILKPSPRWLFSLACAPPSVLGLFLPWPRPVKSSLESWLPEL